MGYLVLGLLCVALTPARLRSWSAVWFCATALTVGLGAVPLAAVYWVAALVPMLLLSYLRGRDAV